MKPYQDLINQIPAQAWQYVTAEYEEGDDGNDVIQFYWDPEEHPELAPLGELDNDQWSDFVFNAIQRGLDNYETQGSTESSDRNDGASGELDQESDS
jgi:hypothetical protein